MTLSKIDIIKYPEMMKIGCSFYEYFKLYIFKDDFYYERT